MPNKHAVKERAWGTRYDTLKSSPSSPITQSSLACAPTDTHSAITTQSDSGIVDDKTTAADDTLPFTIPTKVERANNDSTIFVGR